MLRLRTGNRDPLTCPRPSGTLSPKGARAVNVVWGKLKLICNICCCVRIRSVSESGQNELCVDEESIAHNPKIAKELVSRAHPLHDFTHIPLLMQ